MSERSLKYNTGYPFALQMHASIHILHRRLKVPLAKFSIKPQENICSGATICIVVTPYRSIYYSLVSELLTTCQTTTSGRE